jgi:WD40 repeat protein
MSNIFKNMKSEGLEKSEDRLGGFEKFASDIYTGPIKNMFAGESKNGAVSITVMVDTGNGKEYRETLYITNKSKENYFVKDGKKQPLPGFSVVNDICLIATGKELADLESEDKIVKVWDPETKTEQPKSVPVVTECLGKVVSLGILNQLENKEEKDANGVYKATAETKVVNLIDKVFHPEMKVTVAEARMGKEKGEFWDAWLKKNQGQQRDRRDIKDGGVGGPATPPKAGSAPAAAGARPSLFGKK